MSTQTPIDDATEAEVLRDEIQRRQMLAVDPAELIERNLQIAREHRALIDATLAEWAADDAAQKD